MDLLCVNEAAQVYHTVGTFRFEMMGLAVTVATCVILPFMRLTFTLRFRTCPTVAAGELELR